MATAMEIISKLDFPYPPLTSTYDDIAKGTLKDYTNYSHVNRVKSNNLGLVVIDINDLQKSNDYTARYTLIERVKSRRHDSIASPYDYWKNNKDEVIKLSIEEMKKWPSKYGNYTQDLLYQCSETLFRTGIPSSFPIPVMLSLLEHIKDPRILDISAGWGDRLIGACKLNAFYTACDPNTKLSKAYKDIIDIHGSHDRQKVFCSPFEDWIIEGDSQYNVLFTSPPFFNLEIYTDEPNQSIERYKTIDDWINKFILVCLEKCNRQLSPNAKVYLHLADVINFKHTEKSIIYVQKIIQYCINTLNWKFIGNYGYCISDPEKISEDRETLSKKNKTKLIERTNIKLYKDGIRCDNKGSYLAQAIWHFIKV